MPFLHFPTGSFAVYIGDHLWFGIICGPVWGSLPVWGSFAVGDHLRPCTDPIITSVRTPLTKIISDLKAISFMQIK